MKITATGQLQHHFWGEYAASIYLHFHSEALAVKAQALAFPTGSTKGTVLGFHGGGEALRPRRIRWSPTGRVRAKIGSLKCSD